MKHLLLGILALSVISCSNTLTEEEALTVLKEQFTKECHAKLYNTSSSGQSNFRKWFSEVKKLEKEGLVEMESNTQRDALGTYTDVRSITTGKGRSLYGVEKKYDKYGYGKYRVARAVITDIKGIKMNDDNSAEVLFTYDMKQTPLYKIANIQNCEIGSAEHNVTLVKYDSGWRIQ